MACETRDVVKQGMEVTLFPILSCSDYKHMSPGVLQILHKAFWKCQQKEMPKFVKFS